jgi:plastocyanin
VKVVVAFLLLVALAGCGSGDDGGEGDGGGAEALLEVTAVDFAFEPSSLEAAEGGATLVLANDGEFPHALAVEGADASTDTIDPGASTELALDLEAGSYTVFCPVGDHRDRGMEGTLVVGGAAAADGGDVPAGDDSKPVDDSGYGYG